MRYRGGERQGYASRLHYFSEWIADGERRGLVRDLGAELGGVEDARPLRFMTEHRASYAALADDAEYGKVESIERGLDGRPRRVVPTERIPAIADRLESGDVLAFATGDPGAGRDPRRLRLSRRRRARCGCSTRPCRAAWSRSPAPPCRRTSRPSGGPPGSWSPGRSGLDTVASERQKMLAGELYDPMDPELVAGRARARDLCQALNATREAEQEDRRRILRELFAAGGDSVWMQPPFFCDYGSNIELGERVFFNFNCVVLDVCPVRIGSFTLFGPAVQISRRCTRSTRSCAGRRSTASRFEIGSDVWVGGAAIILPGVTYRVADGHRSRERGDARRPGGRFRRGQPLPGDPRDHGVADPWRHSTQGIGVYRLWARLLVPTWRVTCGTA